MFSHFTLRPVCFSSLHFETCYHLSGEPHSSTNILIIVDTYFDINTTKYMLHRYNQKHGTSTETKGKFSKKIYKTCIHYPFIRISMIKSINRVSGTKLTDCTQTKTINLCSANKSSNESKEPTNHSGPGKFPFSLCSFHLSTWIHKGKTMVNNGNKNL